MDHGRKLDVPLAHQVEMRKALQLLLHQLGCDHWYVACHHEHLFVYHLTKAGVDRYAACFQCSPPLEKGIYHGGKAWSLSLIPLQPGEKGEEGLVKLLSADLAALA
jgi:hypothetical protein